MRSLRVVILPRFRGNPYLDQLEEQLSHLGVDVVRFDQNVPSILLGFARERPDVVHLHWLDPFFVASDTPRALIKLVGFIGTVLLLKLLGRRIVWTVHNLKAHDDRNPRLDRFCTTFVAKRADAIIVHCEAASRALVDEFGLKQTGKVSVIPHGHYCGVYENKTGRSEARRVLGVDESRLMLLFLGQVRPYKGVLDLIDAFVALNHNEVELVIAGKTRDDRSSEVIRRRCAVHPRIMYQPGFVADDDIQTYMNACDAVVLPYRDILTSGAVILAMSFGRACIHLRAGRLERIAKRHEACDRAKGGSVGHG